MNKLTCLFGFHDYSKRITKDKRNNFIHLCKICKRNGYYKYSNDDEEWYKYDDKGNMIYSKNSYGYERWINYNDKGNLIHNKNSNGYEVWKHNSKWVASKPENWKYAE